MWQPPRSKSWQTFEIVEYSSTELQRLIRRRERLVTELRRDAVPVAVASPQQTLNQRVVPLDRR
jgi:hypothetical protein